MPALLLTPLFKIGAIAVAALAIWGYIAWLKHDAASAWAAAEQHRANEAVKGAALGAALASIDELKADVAARDRGNAAMEKNLDDARKLLAKSRRALQSAAAPLPNCGLPPKLIALADSLRKSTPARSGDANPDRPVAPAGRIAEAVPTGPGAAAR